MNVWVFCLEYLCVKVIFENCWLNSVACVLILLCVLFVWIIVVRLVLVDLLCRCWCLVGFVLLCIWIIWWLHDVFGVYWILLGMFGFDWCWIVCCLISVLVLWLLGLWYEFVIWDRLLLCDWFVRCIVCLGFALQFICVAVIMV